MSAVIVEIPEEYARSFGATAKEAARNASIELAIEMYREGKWSTGKAARFAAMNRWEFMDVLMQRNVPFPYTLRMLEQDLAYARGRLG
jgi:predicted HTH domain antitoxin